MPKIWFTADTHFGHGNIVKYCNRPFLAKSDIEALKTNGGEWHDGNWKGEFASRHRISYEAIELMNNTIIDNINKYVGEDDVLWHLGDFAFAPEHKYVQQCTAYRNRIRCQNVNIVWGNHDEASCDEPSDDDYLIRHLFDKARHLVTMRVSGQKDKLVLCHYAFAVWDKSHRGAIHLYGHSHTTAEPGLDKHFPGRRSLDVGVDNAYKLLGEYRPFSLDEVLKLVGNKPGHVLDHHTPRRVDGPEESHT